MLETLTVRIRAGDSLTAEEAEAALEQMLARETSDETIEAFLVALADKGESAAEVTGFARVMRKLSIPIECPHAIFVDTAGTGGGRPTFNISTAAAFVIAGAGVPVAKHGNRAFTSRSGSADVLRALDVNIEQPPEVSRKALAELGICFLFAPLFHPAMKRVAEIRRRLKRRTIFNLVGPLTNPARAPFQLLGAYSESAAELLAGSLQQLGSRGAWVVHSGDDMDEISAATPTRVYEVSDSRVRSFSFQPPDGGEDLPEGKSPEENADLIRRILQGEVRDSTRRTVLLNAAAAIHLAAGNEFGAALEKARESLDSGRAKKKLDELIKVYRG